MDEDRLPHLIMEYQPCGETKPRTTPREASRLFVGPEQVTRLKTLQAVWTWFHFFCHETHAPPRLNDFLEPPLLEDDSTIVSPLSHYLPPLQEDGGTIASPHYLSSATKRRWRYYRLITLSFFRHYKKMAVLWPHYTSSISWSLIHAME
jgi:hypothetical protein